LRYVALIVALICFALGIGYATGVLQLGAHGGGPHFKHALLFTALGVVGLVWMRFQSGASTPNAR
jgi:hypothetical protein